MVGYVFPTPNALGWKNVSVVALGLKAWLHVDFQTNAYKAMKPPIPHAVGFCRTSFVPRQEFESSERSCGKCFLTVFVAASYMKQWRH